MIKLICLLHALQSKEYEIDLLSHKGILKDVIMYHDGKERRMLRNHYLWLLLSLFLWCERTRSRFGKR